MKAQLPGSLADADLVFGYGAPTGRDALGWDLGEALAPLGDKAKAFDNLDALVKAVVAAAQPGDQVLVMSNGGFGGVHQKLLDALSARASYGATGFARAGRSVILYLHGFRSSPNSFKARVMAARLAELGRSEQWCCPMLPVSPLETIALAESLVASAGTQRVTVVGSSLGGYFATHLAEKHGWPAVLLNPAVVPQRDLSQYLGEQPLWHGGGSIVVEPHHLDELRALGVASITRPERYYLIAATGDEVLDYREMLAHYPGARTMLIEGSNHAISEFEQYVDDVLAFCDAEDQNLQNRRRRRAAA